MKRPDAVIFKKYLMNLTPEELSEWITKYENVKKVQIKNNINNLKLAETQSQLEVIAPVTECPYCQSKNIKRNGTENYMQRYLCANCHSTFKATTNTFMEKTNFTWEQWVKLLQMTLNFYSLDEIIDTLSKDYGLDGIHRQTVLFARHKLLHAMSLMPKPTLSGIIQVDETFFRENQKGTRTDKGIELINVLPKSILERRLPRRGIQPSRLGTMGPEYACVVCAVDNSGHVVSVITSLGKLDPKVFTDCFDQYFKDITYLCSDGSPIYNDYCRLKSIAHYVRPSSFVNTLKQSGYTFGVRAEDAALNDLYEKNRKIASKLYKDGLLDFIEYHNSIPFEDFYAIRKQYGLSLSRVNAFHNHLKEQLLRTMTGVATKYLPMYLDAFCFMYNWKTDHQSTLSSMKEAEIVFKELIKNKGAFTLTDLKKKDFFIAPTPTGRYLQLLDERTKEMRRRTDNKFFKFDEEDRVISFDHRKYIQDTSVGKLRPIGKEYKIKGYTKMTHWQLYCAIMDLPKEDIEKIVCELISKDKVYNIYEEDLKFITGHKIQNKELTYSKGTDYVDLERLFIIKGSGDEDTDTNNDSRQNYSDYMNTVDDELPF